MEQDQATMAEADCRMEPQGTQPSDKAPSNDELGTVTASSERIPSEAEKEGIMKMIRERQGTAHIKSDFINFSKIHVRYGEDNPSRPEEGREGRGDEAPTAPRNTGAEPPAKKQKKQKARGMNHHRPHTSRWVPMSAKVCPALLAGDACRYGDGCNYLHDLAAAGAARPPDLPGHCHNFATFGRCRHGLACRFGAGHLTADFRNVVDEERWQAGDFEASTSNLLPMEAKVKLRKKKFEYPRAEQFLKQLAEWRRKKKDACRSSQGGCPSKPDPNSGDPNAPLSHTVSPEESIPSTLRQDGADNPISSPADAVAEGNGHAPAASASPPPQGEASLSDPGPVAAETPQSPPTIGAVTDQDVIRLRRCEKKPVDFAGKSYLAPLTTVGNLPFRRVCKRLGADITCGEMAMSTNLLQGHPSEWALLKRHRTEDVFGVQLAGYFPDSVSKCAELINTYCEVDFVDLNVGCPIDLVYQKGGGSALMGRAGKFEDIVRGLDTVLDVPVTVKMRTGISDKHSIAHKLIPKIYDWGASLVTLHGRSREQRYTRTADWNYIQQCVEVAKPHPLIGNGDILSFEDVNVHLENSGAAGVMIARGALIKPWIFTEIKEQRHWDISANERLDLLREFTNYGMEHWGSDTEGVEKTRRFLLEWLSFLHRYIPVGVLERLPQKIQERPPHYLGRNDLETLMASSNCSDWVQISEMLLGPVPNTFQFLPKHKANSYS